LSRFSGSATLPALQTGGDTGNWQGSSSPSQGIFNSFGSMEINLFGDLWDDSGEDDEDYDPLKDPLNKGSSDDSDSDFEGLRALLSPKRGGRNKKGKGGKASESEAENDMKTPDGICKRTRRHVQIPDEILTISEDQLEK
jgi:hypothetical protein